MTIAKDIINNQMPDFDYYLNQGETLDDIDEYGFTPLIETVITKQPFIAEQLIKRGVDVNIADITGRSALHWAVDNNDIHFTELLLRHKANPNAYSSAGLSILVYPVLRDQGELKQLLYKYGAKLDFALDFIYAKLLGHRFELTGDVDILNAQDEFIEVDFEGFILEFTVDILEDALRRFTSSFSTKHLRQYFPKLLEIMDALHIANQLLKLQHVQKLSPKDLGYLENVVRLPLLILPAASQGHAIGFVKYKNFWAKIDRGENSLREGCINIYRIEKPQAFNVKFLQDFLYKKQPRNYFHKIINQILQLTPIAKIPISPQIAGNCSWANIQATVLSAYALQTIPANKKFSSQEARKVYDLWIEWDKDRSLDEAIQRYYLVSEEQKASYISIFAAILFQACDYQNKEDLERAEKLISILILPENYYVLETYLEVYCTRRLTARGNNLLKLLEDYGFNPNVGVSFVATGLKGAQER